MRPSPTCNDCNCYVRYSNSNTASIDPLLPGGILKHSFIVKADVNTVALLKALWVLCRGLFGIDFRTLGS